MEGRFSTPMTPVPKCCDMRSFFTVCNLMALDLLDELDIFIPGLDAVESCRDCVAVVFCAVYVGNVAKVAQSRDTSLAS